MDKSYMSRAVKESLQQTMQKKGPHHGPKTKGNPSGNSLSVHGGCGIVHERRINANYLELHYLYRKVVISSLFYILYIGAENILKR